MEVNVEYRLSGGLSDVDAKIEAIWLPLLDQHGPRFVGEREKITTLLSRAFKPICDMTPRDQQHVSWSHWRSIKQRKSKPILKHHGPRLRKGQFCPVIMTFPVSGNSNALAPSHA